MNQFINDDGQPVLQLLPYSNVPDQLNAESALLAASWFAVNAQPGALLCTLADRLAYTMLVQLASHLETESSGSGGAALPYLHHFRDRNELVLLLSWPQRTVAVRLRALATNLLRQRSHFGQEDLFAIFGEAISEVEKPVSAQHTAIATRFAATIGIRITTPWHDEVVHLLRADDVTVLPALPPHELH